MTNLNTSTLPQLVECPKCLGGKRFDHFAHIANGKCFTCNGTGMVEYYEKTSTSSNTDTPYPMFARLYLHATTGEAQKLVYGKIDTDENGEHENAYDACLFTMDDGSYWFDDNGERVCCLNGNWVPLQTARNFWVQLKSEGAKMYKQTIKPNGIRVWAKA